MTKLTQTQRTILSSACDHKLGLATRPAGLGVAQAVRSAISLIKQGWAKEIRAKAGMPVWREDGEDRPVALKISKLGREAIASAEGQKTTVGPTDDSASGSSHHRDDPPSPPSSQPTVGPYDQTAVGAAPSLRAGTKQAIVVDMLKSKDGATLEALVSATGWLPHTTRAALTGLRKKGFEIAREAQEGAPSIYRIIDGQLAAAA